MYLKSVENVITLGKLIGLLFFCLPLLSILFLITKRNDLARPVMGTVFLVRYISRRMREADNKSIVVGVYVYVVRTSSLNEMHSCQLSRKAASFSSIVLLSSSVSTANLSCLLATTFSSLRFLFNFTSLQSFESGQALFLVVIHFLIFASYPQSSAVLYSVSEALFALSFSFLSERFFFVHAKSALARSRNQ